MYNTKIMINNAFINLADKCKKIRLLLPREPKFRKYAACLKEIRRIVVENCAPTTSDYIYNVEKVYRIVSRITHEWTGLSPKQVVTEYINRVNNPIYARRSGKGHLVQNNPSEIKLIILPAYYGICCPTPCEQIAMQTDRRDISISPEITYLKNY